MRVPPSEGRSAGQQSRALEKGRSKTAPLPRVSGLLIRKQTSQDFLAEVRAALLRFAVADRHHVGGGLADEKHLLPSARQGGVEEIPLEHHKMAF